MPKLHHPARRRSWDRAAATSIAIALVCVIFALASVLTPTLVQQRESPALLARSLDSYSHSSPPESELNADELCRKVRHAHDQCAYIHANCPKDDAGFVAYINLYYCSLSHVKPIAFIILATWMAMLFSTIGIAASDFFCVDLSAIAQILGMSEGLTGVTFLAFGNGSPDVFSTFAAMSTNSGSLAIGELFGAACFITASVSGAMAIVRPFKVVQSNFIRDVAFFAVAAVFSLGFLLDGKLHFWECLVMVLYYLFYVIFVVVWHMWQSRKASRRMREAAARGHFIQEDEVDLANEPYRDDPADPTESRRPSVGRALSREDWSALERGGDAEEDYEYEDEEEAARNKWFSELSNEMRLTRPAARSRRYTATPIRPSLMGALEFQAVLKSLSKSRNMQTIPMHSRRYSDDPHYAAIPADQMSTTSDPSAAHHSSEDAPLSQGSTNALAPPSAPVGRARAVSANDAASLRLTSTSQFRSLSPVPSEDNLIDLTHNDGQPHLPVTHGETGGQRPSPTVLIEPATPRREAPLHQMRGRSSTTASGNLLAPPNAVPVNRPHSDYFLPTASQGSTSSAQNSPTLIPRARDLPRIVIPRGNRSPGSSRSTSPFPAYRDLPSPSLTAGSRSPTSEPPSIYLPEPLASPESIPADQSAEQEVPRQPTWLNKVWPDRILPPPRNIISTLFPAFYHWKDKSWLEKVIGVYSALPVFLLTITLPIVESEEKDEKSGSTSSAKSTTADSAVVVTPKHHRDGSWFDSAHPHTRMFGSEGMNGKTSSAGLAAHTEQQRGNIGRNTPQISITAEPEPIDINQKTPDKADEEVPELWNRWLTIIQLFLAPLLIVFAIFVQGDDLEARWLVRPILISLLVSLVLLVPLLLTTTPTYRPKCYRWILSSVGFIVAIAWISTVASQVVGILKAIAVIMNMSEAIMGLTIFAVGNSLGDLVADITVANLGYPFMALSACFAGPMMNILLGIGLSGSYALILGEEKRRRKHPEKGIRFKSFHIEVSKTLIVSGITLVITLCLLMIVVPWNKWIMDKKIGILLITVWVIGTLVNVVIEYTPGFSA